MALRLDETQVRKLLSEDDAIAAVLDAHKDLALGNAVNVPRSRARLPNAILHSMSAASATLGLAAAKVYTSTRGGVHSYIQLFSTETGELRAHLAANELGRLRTSAASVLAARELTKGNTPRTLALIGCGYQAAGILPMVEAPSSGFNFTQIRIFSRNEEKRQEFCERHRSAAKANLVSAASPEEALSGAEVVITTTTSSTPVIPENLPAEVRHISALGSNSLARRELPPRVVSGARLIVVDEKATAELEAGNLLAPLEYGKINWQEIKELGAILNGKEELPTEPGYTLFCSHGLAVQDLYLAAKLVKKAKV